MRKAWIVSALASLLPLFLAACINSGDQPPEHVLPDPAELIAERRMETIRAHRMLIVGIVVVLIVVIAVAAVVVMRRRNST